MRVRFFVSVLLFCMAAWAQSTGTLDGTVTDASGTGVPNASVVITPVTGGAPQRVLTGPDGRFTVSGLRAGRYRIEVESRGATHSSAEVDITPGSPVRVTLSAAAAAVEGTVEVEGSSPNVQDQSGEISRRFGTRMARELPLRGRNPQELVGLMPGVTPPYLGTGELLDPQRNRLWETNGQAYWTHQRQFDGLENDEPFLGIAVHVPPVESIQQVNVTTSNYSADKGRATGAIVNMITRPGTNQVHGSLFWFHNDSAFRARNFFNPRPNPQPHDTLNEFGGSVGAPIIRDSTFFFGSYQGDIRRAARTRILTVPTAALRAGNFSGVPGVAIFDPATGTVAGSSRRQFTGNVIPANRINPAASAILSSIPLPNAPGFENNFIDNTTFNTDGHRADGRIDHRFSDATSMFVRYGISWHDVFAPSALGAVVGGGGQSELRAHNAAVRLTHDFAGSTIMDLGLNYNRYDSALRGVAGSTAVPAGFFGFATASANPALGGGLPRIQIGGMPPLGNPANFPSDNIDNTYNLTNGWSKVMDRHNLRVGVDLWYTRTDGFQNLTFGPQGGFVFTPGPTSVTGGPALGQFGTFANSFASFLLGAPTLAGREILLARPAYSQWLNSAYVSDTFSLTPRLTINLGLRYESFLPVKARHAGEAFLYDPGSNTLSPAGIGGLDKSGNAGYDWNNFAPRFGFAFRAASRTVVRGGYGISYFNPPLQYSAAHLIPAMQAAQTGIAGSLAVAGPFTTVPSVVTPTGVTGAPNRPLVASPADRKTPMVHSYSVQLQQDLGAGIAVDLAYVGNLGRHLPYSWELNAAAPGTGIAGLPFFTAFGRTASTIEHGNGLNSNFDSFQASLTKRFSAGLSFSAAYTYSRARDYGPGFVPLLNNIDLAANYGLADWDLPHMFVLSHLWQLPFGAGTRHLNEGWVGQLLGNWQLNGVLRASSGQPLTVTADPTLCACPGNTSIANIVQTGTTTQFITAPTIFGFWATVPFQFPTFSFAPPAPGTFGNAGRNSVRMDPWANYDLSIFRSFPIGDRYKLEFRGEAFNLTNTRHFAPPVTNINAANFGQSTATMPNYGERTINVGLRILF